MSPRFLGGEYEHRRQQSAQSAENFVHDHLGRASPRRICSVAVHPVLGDIDVEAAQVDGAKLVERVINFMKLKRFICRSGISNHVVQTLQNPAVDQRCSGHRRYQPAAARVRRKIIKISKQNTQRVPDPAIRVAQTCENLFGKWDVSGVIDAARPQPNEIRAVFAYKMAGVYRLLVSAGFGNFLSVEIDNETVRYASFVRCSIIQRDAREERRLKPAA